MAGNRAAWQTWNSALGEGRGIRTAGGKLVTASRANEADGVVRGVSMVEFDTLEDAVRVAQGAPNLAFGAR